MTDADWLKLLDRPDLGQSGLPAGAFKDALEGYALWLADEQDDHRAHSWVLGLLRGRIKPYLPLMIAELGRWYWYDRARNEPSGIHPPSDVDPELFAALAGGDSWGGSASRRGYQGREAAWLALLRAIMKVRMGDGRA